MGNSTNKALENALFQQLYQESISESNKEFWDKLFVSTTPEAEIPDLAQIINTQRANIKHICQLSTENLESTWLNLAEQTQVRTLATENSLNFLAAIIPITIEHNLHDFFWDSRMLAYRIIKASCGLFFTVGFAASSSHESCLDSSNFLMNSDPIEGYCKRKRLILKMLLACIAEKNYSWKMLFTREIVDCRQFIYGLLNILNWKSRANSPGTIQNVVKLLERLIQARNSEEFSDLDMQFIKMMLNERKSLSVNAVKFFFQTLSEEAAIKVITAIKNAFVILENTEGIQYLIDFLASLCILRSDFSKITSSPTNSSLVSSILSSKKWLNYRISGVPLLTLFYHLSHYRDFSVSLTIPRSNTLIQLLCRMVLVPDFEFQDYFPSLFGTLCNISAYTISLDALSSELLINAYEYILNKDWILEKEKNHHNIFYIIQALTNAIQYQYDGCGYLIYHMVKRRESFYKVIRMQISTAEEANLDDKDTEGEISDLDDPISDSSESSGGHHVDLQRANEEEKQELSKRGSKRASSRREVSAGSSPAGSSEEDNNRSEREDRVVELERISEGLLIGLNYESPDEVVQRTSYLNTHVSTFSEDIDRRNTVQHMPVESVKDEEWRPTPQWMLMWKTRLPMKVIFVTIKESFSIVVKMQEGGKGVDEIAQAICENTLVGLLPRPHPIYLILQQ